MELGNVELAAGLDEVCNHLGPAFEVWQPADHAIGREYDVERPVQHLRQVIHAAFDEPRVDSKLRCQRTRLLHCRAREVDTRNNGALACPGQRVHAEMTLQME